MAVLIIQVNAIVPSQNQANFTMEICTEYSLRTTLYCSSIKGVLEPLNIRKYKRYTNVCCHLLFSCREKTQLRKEDEKRKKIRGAGRGCNLASEAKMEKK